MGHCIDWKQEKINTVVITEHGLQKPWAINPGGLPAIRPSPCLAQGDHPGCQCPGAPSAKMALPVPAIPCHQRETKDFEVYTSKARTYVGQDLLCPVLTYCQAWRRSWRRAPWGTGLRTGPPLSKAKFCTAPLNLCFFLLSIYLFITIFFLQIMSISTLV